MDLLAGRDRYQANKCTECKRVLKIPRGKKNKQTRKSKRLECVMGNGSEGSPHVNDLSKGLKERRE